MESPDTAEFMVTVGPSRAEYVQQVLGTARATLQRMRARDEFEFREQPVDAPDVPERSRSRPLAPRDHTPLAPPLDTPTWADERAAVFEAISGLRQLCETLTDELAAIRWRQLGTSFDSPRAAFRELNRWEQQERARSDLHDQNKQLSRMVCTSPTKDKQVCREFDTGKLVTDDMPQ